MNRNRSKGFTLIELLITIAVFLVLVGLGVPSFMSAIKNSKLNRDYSQLIGSLYLARSEAVKRSGTVTVCARETDDSCGSNWNNGWLVFTDNTQGEPGTVGEPGAVDGTDVILSISPPLDGRRLSAKGTSFPNPSSAGSSTTQSEIIYSSTGGSSWSGGTFVMCDDRGEEHAVTTNLALTGDIRKGRTRNGAIPVDVHGINVECP